METWAVPTADCKWCVARHEQNFAVQFGDQWQHARGGSDHRVEPVPETITYPTDPNNLKDQT